MRYCHHCGAEVGPQAEVCDECDGDLFEPPEDLRADLEGIADADDGDTEDAEADAAEGADAEVADIEDGEPDVDAETVDGAAAAAAGSEDEADAEAEVDADAAAGDDGDAEGDGRVDSLFSSDGSTADASDDEQGFVAKIKALFQ